MSELRWRRSSRSGPNGDNCVEVATARARVFVRDSKDPDGGMLTVSPAEWRTFLADVGR